MASKATQIGRVQTCVVRVPLDVETSFATRKVAARDYCLVRVKTADGAEGIGRIPYQVVVAGYTELIASRNSR